MESFSFLCMSFQWVCYLHLLMPTLEEPANQGSRMKTHLNVVAPLRPSRRDGLSCNRSPLRNQCTVCFACPLDAGPLCSLTSTLIYLTEVGVSGKSCIFVINLLLSPEIQSRTANDENVDQLSSGLLL